MSQSSPLVGLFRRINDSHDPLGAGMDMHMLNPDRLLVATRVLVQSLNQLQLEPEQSSRIAAGALTGSDRHRSSKARTALFVAPYGEKFHGTCNHLT
jgi:hypothetical protein